MKLEWMSLFWLALTLAAYVFSRWSYRRTGRYLLSPLILVPVILLAVAIPLHTAYAEYSRDTHWLILVLGPATVAFAVPIWQQRGLIVRHWPALLLGMLAGSVASIGSSYGLARALSLDSALAPGSGSGRRPRTDGGVRADHRCVRRDGRWCPAQMAAVAQQSGAWRAVRHRCPWCRGQPGPRSRRRGGHGRRSGDGPVC